MSIETDIQQFRDAYQKLKAEISKVIVGHEPIIDGTLVAIFSGGHVLLEGVPGLGKTLLVRTLSRALNLSFNRVQFTPDLMPADIVGTNLVVENSEGGKAFEFQHEFSPISSADEINHATRLDPPLEVMQEQCVTADGASHPQYPPCCTDPIDGRLPSA